MKEQLLTVQFSDNDEFLKCIELLTTQLDPGAPVQVVAPRVIILHEARVAQCRDKGIQFRQVTPVLSLSDLPPEEALRIRREHRLQSQKQRLDFLGGVGPEGVRLLVTRPDEAR